MEDNGLVGKRPEIEDVVPFEECHLEIQRNDWLSKWDASNFVQAGDPC